jgi:quercetin dioxygenase-like cupin family protein
MHQTMQTTIKPIQATTVPDYRQYMGGFFRVLLSPEQTGGAVAIMDMTVPRGAEPPPHLHTREDEMFYVLEGEVDFHIGGSLTKTTAGASVFAPRQVPHQFSIQTPTARLLVVITPGQFLSYFLDFSLPTTEPAVVPPQGPPPAEFIERMVTQLGQQHGVVFL